MTSTSLKRGFTTGASASVTGTLFYLLSGKPVQNMTIRFLNGETGVIRIFKTERISADTAYCSVIKDAGDDPDVTHKAEIGARVSLQVSGRKSDIWIIGGQGVCKVTKPGLEKSVGGWAINSGPSQMMIESANEMLSFCKITDNSHVRIEVIVPKGRVLAKKTLNFRLGIVGEISILGTTGIVMPMSDDAYVTSIRSGISVAASLGQIALFSVRACEVNGMP